MFDISDTQQAQWWISEFHQYDDRIEDDERERLSKDAAKS